MHNERIVEELKLETISTEWGSQSMYHRLSNTCTLHKEDIVSSGVWSFGGGIFSIFFFSVYNDCCISSHCACAGACCAFKYMDHLPWQNNPPFF